MKNKTCYYGSRVTSYSHANVFLYQENSVLYVSERLGHVLVDIVPSTYAHLLKERRERDSSKTISIFEDLLTYSG